MRTIRFLFVLAAVASFSVFSHAADSPKADVLVFSNGDQLTGRLVRIAGGNVIFKSDMAGELTIGFDKIEELRSGSEASQFALLRKGIQVKEQRTAPEGTVLYADGSLTVTPPAAAPVTAKPAEVAYLIDKATYDKSVAHSAGILEGWSGIVSAGATLVRSSQNGSTVTASTSLVRAIPTVPYLPARNRTIFNVSESYGTLTTVAPPPPVTTPLTPYPTVKTNIFHGDVERDEYFTPRLFALVNAAFDHNYSQGLQLQQLYGGGVGWTVLKSASQQLDVKADAHYEMQSFIQPVPTVPPAAPAVPVPDITLFGSTFAETYRRTLPHKLVFLEAGSFLPGWTNSNAYSASVGGTLTLPVFKRLNASVSATDNYLNNPAPGYLQNSFQFVTGLTYSLR